MSHLEIRGGVPLSGRLRVQGAKNSVLPILAAALLRDPARRDSMIRALNSMAVPDAGEKIYQTLMGLLKK